MQQSLIRLGIVVGLLLSSGIWSHSCELTWLDDNVNIQGSYKDTSSKYSLIYCRDVPVKVSRDDYLTILRSYRATVNMDLFVNGEFITGPCEPGAIE